MTASPLCSIIRINGTRGRLTVTHTNELDPKLREIRECRVVKANDLIQKTRFSFSTQEQKIILYLITKIKPEDGELKLYEFKIKEFCEICGMDETSGKNYSSIKAALKRLADKSMWIIMPNGEETLLRWIERPFISEKNGTIKIKLDDIIKPYLIQLKERFTQYSLHYTLAMRSRYSIRLYELLKSCEYKQICEFQIDALKTMLSAEKYARYPDFKRNVLDIAVKEINMFSDLSVSCKSTKKGRKYAFVAFEVKLKNGADGRLETWPGIDSAISRQKESTKELKRDGSGREASQNSEEFYEPEAEKEQL